MADQSKKKHTQKTPRGGAVWLVAAGALVLLAAVVFAVLRPGSGGTAGEGSAGGTPKLAVDRQEIDFGDVKMNVPVTATFKITNEGTGTLRFTGAPTVQVLEGC